MNNHSKTQCDDSRYDQDDRNDLNTNDETSHTERPNSCDNRDFSQDTGDTMQSHRRSKDYGLHSGVASGLRTVLATSEIIAAVLASSPPPLCDLRTVVRLNFKEVERQNGSF